MVGKGLPWHKWQLIEQNESFSNSHGQNKNQISESEKAVLVSFVTNVAKQRDTSCLQQRWMHYSTKARVRLSVYIVFIIKPVKTFDADNACQSNEAFSSEVGS